MRINVSILTLNHLRRSGPWGELILLSHSFPTIPESFDEVTIERLMDEHGHEWSAIWVEHSPGGAKVRLWRSLTSSFDIYYLPHDSTWFISDSFAACARQVPPQDRHPSNDAILDHFIFRAPFGEDTYIEKVRRVPHATRVTIDTEAGTLEKHQFATYTPRPKFRTDEQVLADVDTALDESLAEFHGYDQAVLFSGGIDSTLVASYLPPNPLVASAINSPEFAKEASYAQDAAEMLGKKLIVMTLDEQAFLRRFEQIVDNLWIPPHHAVTVILSEAFESDHRNYIMGEFADGLFGLFRHSHAYYGPMLAKPGIKQALDALGALPSKKLRMMRSLASAFSTPPTQPGSFAFRFGRSPEFGTPGRFFTAEEIDRRVAARYEYVSRFMKFVANPCESSAHLEIGQSLGYFCIGTLNVWRQLAALSGKTVYAPFVNRRMFDMSMSIPPSQRFMNAHTQKYILKNLLIRRVPVYPVHQEKLAGGLPLQRFAESGCLQQWSDRYPPPDFIDQKNLARMQSVERGAFWNTLLYSVWRGRIASLTTSPPPLVSFDLDTTHPATISERTQ